MLKWTILPARKKRTVYAYYDTTPSGKLTQKRIHSYYEQRSVCAETENGTQRADIVLARRQYKHITKEEWVLGGDTIIYADWDSIKETLDYYFFTEKQFSYESLSVNAAVKTFG